MRNQLTSSLRTLCLLAAVVSLARPAQSGDGCCAHCGCHNACQKICRLVCEDKKIEVICWGCKCEDFCVGKPSKKGCEHCEMVCAENDGKCAASDVSTQPKKFVWTEWIPCSAKIHTKKKLMKKVETKKVPSFKWVVEDLCEQCEANCDVADIPAGVNVPAPPVVDAKLKYGQVGVVPKVEVK